MAVTNSQSQRDGRRVLVLWLLWLALVAILMVAGVVAFAHAAPPPRASGAAPSAAVEGLAAAPAAGELVRTELRTPPDLAPAGPTATLRLCGLPIELIPFCELKVAKVDENGREQSALTARPDANGRLRCPAAPGTRLRARIAGLDGDVLCALPDGALDFLLETGEVEVRPTEELLGLQVVDGANTLPAFLDLRKPVGGGPRRECCLVAERVLATATDIFGIASGLGPFRVASASGRRVGRIVQIDPRSGIRCASLAVTVPRGDQAGWLGLRLLSLQDRTATICRCTRNGDLDEFTAIVPAGGYRLDWTIGAGPGPVAMPFLGFAAGEDRQLELVPPHTERWLLVVDDWQGLEAVKLGTPGARIDGIWGLGTLADAMVPFALERAPTRAAVVELRWHAQRTTIAVRIVAVDAGARELHVRADLGRDDVVSVIASPALGGKAAIWLANPGFPVERNPAWLGPIVALPLRAGEGRDGCVVEELPRDSGAQRQVTRWFAVAHGDHEVRLEARGRWARVCVDRAIAKAVVLVEGSASMDAIEAATLRRAGTVDIFVADGTRAVHVDCEPGGRQTFEPSLGAFVVR